MTWTQVQQSAAVNSATTGTTTPTLPVASTAGNLLIACLMSVSGTTAFTGPAGWSQVIAIPNGTANRTEIWYNPNNAGGISSAAFTSGTGTVKGALAEFHSSTGTAVTIDATGTGTSAATTCTATATSANSAGDLGVTAWGWKVTTATTITFTPPAGYTDLANNGSVSANAKLDCSWNLSVGAGTAAPQETASVAPTTFAGVVALFLETPAAGLPPRRPVQAPGVAGSWMPQQRPRASDPLLLGTAQPGDGLLGGAGTAGRYNQPATHADRREVPVQPPRLADPLLLRPAARLDNDFDGGTDGTAITTGNSGGASGNAFNGVAVGPVFSAAGAVHGPFAMATPLTAATTSDVFWTTSYTGSWTSFYVRHYFSVPSAPGAITFLSAVNTVLNAANWGIAVDTTGKVGVRDRVAGVYRTSLSAAALVAGADNRYEFQAVFDGVNWTVTLRLFYGANSDGITPDETLTSSAFAAAGGAGRLTVGAQAASAITWGSTSTGPFHDDLVLTDIDWPGPVITSVPWTPPRHVAATHADRREVPAQPARISDPSFYPADVVTDPLTVAWGAGGPYWHLYNTAVSHGDRRLVPAQRAYVSDPSLLTAQSGPPVAALQGPVHAPLPKLPPGGRSRSSAGSRGETGPPLRALPGMVRARVPQLPPGGRTRSSAGTRGQAGPPVTPLQRAVHAPLPKLAAGGRTRSSAGIRAQAGPPVTPLQGPVHAPFPRLAAGGRTRSSAGIRGQTGVPVTPLQRAVRTRLPLRPVLTGRIQSRTGTYGQVGPPVKPLPGPVRTRLPRIVVPRGTAAGRTGAFGQAGPAVRALSGPVAAANRAGAFRKGRAQGTIPVVFGALGPAVRALQGPVRARVPVPGAIRKGRSLSLYGTYTASGNAIATAPLAGAGAVTAVVTQGVTAAPAGTGSVTGVTVTAVTAASAGAAVVTAGAVQIAPADVTGAGTLTGITVQAVTGAPAGTGTVTGAAGQVVTGALAAAGAVADTAVQAVTGTAAGSGAVTADASVLAGGTTATATVAGAGAVTAVAAQIATAALAGAGGVAAAGALPAAAAVTITAAQAALKWHAGSPATRWAASSPGT